MFQTGVQYLATQLFKNAASNASIYRGGVALFENATVVLAKSKFDDIGANGQRISVYTVDVLLTGLNYIPTKGDKFVVDGSTYFVRALGKEIFRFDDPYKTVLRVHVQRESQI